MAPDLCGGPGPAGLVCETSFKKQRVEGRNGKVMSSSGEPVSIEKKRNPGRRESFERK